MQRTLTEGPITRNILLFALPLMFGNLLQQMYNIADTWVVGRFLGADALAAVGVGLMLGVGLEEACAALAGFIPAKGRENIYRKNGFTILDDCYNASPEALAASLGVMAGLEGGRHIACLGDMFELGAQSAAAHAECGRKAAEKCDFLVACGDMARYYIEGARSAGMPAAHTALFLDRTSAAAFLRRLAEPGDVILFKGSHGAHIEQVLSAFLAQ